MFRKWTSSAVSGALLVAAMFLALGCSGPTIGEVSGTVTADGKPIKRGMIAFFAVDRMAPTAGGRIDDGKYTALVHPGLCRVEIRVSGEDPLPARYNDYSELQLDVKLGKNVQNYELTRD